MCVEVSVCFKGFDVTYVRNITDVDDKIINRAREELKEEKEALSAERLRDKTKEVQ